MAQSINLQITPNGVIPTIYASQFDVGREITFNLYDGSTAYTPPAGSTIRFEGKKSDGNGFSYNCTYVDNVVTVVLTDQMTVFAEDVQCELRIADINANDIGTLNVVLSVEKSPIDENTPMSDTEIPAIVELARAEQYSAEAWAEGTRNGVPVGPTDPTYQNNAKYYAEHSSASVSSLSDTDIQNVADNQILVYNGVSSKWENKVDELNRLANVHILNPSDGQALIYDANDDKWVNRSGGGSSTLGGLTDVTLTTPTNNQVLKYDSVTQEWINGDAPSGGAGGSEVTITTVESSLYGQAVTISDGQDTYTGTFDNTGLCIIQGVTITGSATVISTDGVNTATGTLTMPYFGNYSIALSFFSATVNVTFPYANGATCTLSDGVTTLTANTSPMAFSIPNTGTWVATCTLDGQSKTQSFVITTDGQTESHTFEYGTINLTYANEFRGVTLTCSSGGTTISKVAPVGANSMVFYPPSTGTWEITGIYSGVTYSSGSITVSSLSTAVSATLQTTISVNVTLYGAVEDTITFTDESGAKTETFASGQSSKSVSIAILPSGKSITFTSSVAKNPSDLTANYSKTVSITNATTEVKVIPDNAIYWYGNTCDDITGGWLSTGYQYSETNEGVTLATNCIPLTKPSGSGNQRNIGTVNTVSVAGKTSLKMLRAYSGGTASYVTITISGSGTKYIAANSENYSGNYWQNYISESSSKSLSSSDMKWDDHNSTPQAMNIYAFLLDS